MPVDPGNSAACRKTSARSFARGRAIRWLAAVLAVSILTPSAWSQQFKSDQVDEKAKNSKQAALACAAGTKVYASDKDNVLDFFVKYMIPSMTRYTPADLEKLGSARYSLFRDYLWRSTSAEMQQEVTERTFGAMRNIASQGYHPAVRYNAVLIIGLLDQEYAIDQGANRRPPKPLPEANKFLVVVINSALAGKPVPPALVAGALIGLERHAKYRDSLPRDQVEAMTAAAVKIVASDKPLVDVDRDVYAWIRLKAAGVLAQLGTVGTNNQVHDAMLKMIGDGRTIDDRVAVAALLSKIKYDGAKIDGAAAAEKMVALAGAIAEVELKRAEDFRDQRFASGGGAYSGGGEGGRSAFRGGRGDEGGGSYPTEEPLEGYPRRLIVVRLSDLRTGLTTLKPVVPADAQKKFDAIIAAINPVIDAAANKKDIVDLNVANAVVTMSNAIKAIAGTTAPAAAAAEDAGFDQPAVAAAAPPAAAAAAAAPGNAAVEKPPAAPPAVPTPPVAQ